MAQLSTNVTERVGGGQHPDVEPRLNLSSEQLQQIREALMAQARASHPGKSRMPRPGKQPDTAGILDAMSC